MDSRQYIEILDRCLLPFATASMKPGWFLYQDNSPVHKSKLLMGRVVTLSNEGKAHLPGWFGINRVSLFETPPFSPDLNVIENLWAYLKSKLRGKRFNSKVELWFYIRKIWRTIGPGILDELIASMPTRIKEVLLAKGGATKY